MIVTNKNFCLYLMCSVETPASLKGLMNMSARLLVTQGTCRLCHSGFPISGMPRVAALPPVFWLPLLSRLCLADQQQEAEDDVCIQGLPSVAPESAQGSSSFHFNGSVILPSVAKIQVNLWGLGRRMI